MGQRGTDVAREAAAIVLLDDRFGSLVDGIRAGRRIFANLQRAMGYLFAVHVPIVGLSLFPLLGGPMLLMPIHVVLLELIIDPACSLVFEAEPASPREMRVPPRSAATPLFGPGAVLRALAVGTLGLLAVVVIQLLGRAAGWTDEALRLAGLASLVLGNLVMLQWFRVGFGKIRHPNAAFEGLVLAVAALAAPMLLTPPLRAIFGLPAALESSLVLWLLAVPVVWSLWRLLRGRRRGNARAAG